MLIYFSIEQPLSQPTNLYHSVHFTDRHGEPDKETLIPSLRRIKLKKKKKSHLISMYDYELIKLKENTLNILSILIATFDF